MNSWCSDIICTEDKSTFETDLNIEVQKTDLPQHSRNDNAEERCCQLPIRLGCKTKLFG